jgi:hypothetical protein
VAVHVLASVLLSVTTARERTITDQGGARYVHSGIVAVLRHYVFGCLLKSSGYPVDQLAAFLSTMVLDAMTDISSSQDLTNDFAPSF